MSCLALICQHQIQTYNVFQLQTIVDPLRQDDA